MRRDDGSQRLRAEMAAWLSVDPRNARAYAAIAAAGNNPAASPSAWPMPDHDPRLRQESDAAGRDGQAQQ